MTIIRNLLTLFVSILAVTDDVSASVPEFWKSSAYAIECSENSIRDIFQDFGESFGVSVDMTDKVGGSCRGWLRNESADDFLNALSVEHRLNWYVFNNVLYISNTQENIVSEVKIDEGLYDALSALGLVQEKFGWGTIGENKIALVSGPPSYIAHIKRIASRLKEESESEKNEITDKEEMIFIMPLKYASVEDREVTVREQVVKIPGVASILNRIFTGEKSKIEKRENGSGELLDVTKGDQLTVEADIRTNSVVIKSKGRSLEYFKAIVDSLDEPQKLIEIDAVIIDINREKMRDVGVDFGFESQFQSGGNEGNSQFASSLLLQGIDTGSAMLNIADVGKFFVNLRLLESKGDASIVANTSIMTMANQPAFIDLSSTFFIRSVGERVASIDSVTTGTLLNVTPQWISTGEGAKIKMFIEIEDGKVLERTVDQLPVITRSNINTKAMIPEGSALVIGGYHLQSQEKSTRSVPGLGEVPVVKHLFTSRKNKSTQMERIFILTPRVVSVASGTGNSQDYLYYDTNETATKAIGTIQKRWHKASRDYIAQNLVLLQAILENQLPQGYSYRSDMGGDEPFECRAQDMKVDLDDTRVVYGQGLAVYRVTLMNTSNMVLDVYEHSCFGPGLISVVNTGKAALMPQESTMLLVSVEVERKTNRVDYLLDKFY